MDDSERMDDPERIDDPKRIDALEARLGIVESELRNLIDAIDVARSEAGGGSIVRGAAGPPAAPSSRRRPRRSVGPARDLEAWFGQNALLVVGVLALVAAVGFGLKHAIEQGWISPALRVLAGLTAGLALALYGEVTVRRGLRRFGAAAIGAGAALAYLSIWAAAGPYAFASPAVGLTALAVLSVLVLARAWRSDEPYLGAMAAAGAYLAPFVLGDVSSSANLLLGYTALVSVAVTPVAALSGWRSTLTIVLVGYFGTAVVVLGEADPGRIAMYLGVLGGAAVALARGLEWREHELAAWGAGWLGLLLAAATAGAWGGWSFVLAPALLVAPEWISAYRAGRPATNGTPSRRPWTLVPGAVLWTTVALTASPAPVEHLSLAVASPIAALYVLPALRRQLPSFFVAGVGVLAIGVSSQWDGTDVTLGWCVLLAATALLTRRGTLAAARWVGVVLGLLAAVRLLGPDLLIRPGADPAFTGVWPLVLYSLLFALSLLAIDGWEQAPPLRRGGVRIDFRVVTWLLAGVVLLAGGTIEIHRLDISELAAGLGVSAFWLLYAGGLLAFGFRTNSKAVRVTGLVVAALAISKVVFYDLANLDALYRVGSFALLALIALVGARAYHGRARPGGESGSEPDG